MNAPVAYIVLPEGWFESDFVEIDEQTFPTEAEARAQMDVIKEVCGDHPLRVFAIVPIGEAER